MTRSAHTAPIDSNTAPAEAGTENCITADLSTPYRDSRGRYSSLPAAVSRINPQEAATAELGANAHDATPQSPQLGRNRYRLAESLYLPEKYRKDLIVLHFTAGTSCESAYRTWTKDPRRIATAYGVDPDGTIEEFFPPEAWAFHLGIRGTRRHDQRSIGIEIANVGPLRRDPSNPGQLNWWPRNWGTRYCDLDDAERYVATPYRGIDYFAAMPEEQQRAVATLVQSLCQRFDIPARIDDEVREGIYDLKRFASYTGIASHANFRRDKWDVGPAFRWNQISEV
jgi:N-acetyl-anhydromuramyl-L-alanine amidase AmpD